MVSSSSIQPLDIIAVVPGDVVAFDGIIHSVKTRDMLVPGTPRPNANDAIEPTRDVTLSPIDFVLKPCDVVYVMDDAKSACCTLRKS